MGEQRTPNPQVAGSSPVTPASSKSERDERKRDREATMLEKAKQFLREVRAELERVTWPGREEVQAATIVIIVLTILLAAFIGGVDFIVNRVLGLFYRL